ncbi:MAG: LysR family transcriptional regulator [Myxococcota bacterium]
MDWRDLRVVLAVGQHGQLAQAGRALGIDPTTVSRRVSALEEELGVVLFRRTGKRWSLTQAGETVLARAERMAAEVRALRHDVDAVAGRVAGRVRVTAIDVVFGAWLVPALPKLMSTHPELSVELFSTNEYVDLARGQADVAVRLGRPESAGLVVRRVADIPLVLAATPSLMERPASERPVVLVGFLDTESRENTRLRELGGSAVLSTTSLAVSIGLVRSGQAIGVLPADYAERHGLEVVDRDLPSRPLWRAVPEALVDAPRIRAVTDWIDATFGA